VGKPYVAYQRSLHQIEGFLTGEPLLLTIKWTPVIAGGQQTTTYARRPMQCFLTFLNGV